MVGLAAELLVVAAMFFSFSMSGDWLSPMKINLLFAWVLIRVYGRSHLLASGGGVLLPACWLLWRSFWGATSDGDSDGNYVRVWGSGFHSFGYSLMLWPPLRVKDIAGSL